MADWGVTACAFVPRIHRAGVLLAALTLVSGFPQAATRAERPRVSPAAEHQCHLFGYAFGAGAESTGVFSTLCANLFATTLPRTGGEIPGRGGDRETPSRDGWGFGYFLVPPHPGIERPILIKSGAAAGDDSARWTAAGSEITEHGLSAAGTVLGHVRLSSYGPDQGALPNPHPFADSLIGRWWIFAHNGHMRPDTLLPWIPIEFLTRHPLDYQPIHVDSEVLFRYCQFEIERLGSVRAGLLSAFNRVKGYDDFVFNICLADGDTLWAAHTHDDRQFYFDAGADSSSWWVSTVPGEGAPREMEDHHLYWFTPDGMGSESYE
jgi:predicted glutamine amidotransferase